MLDGTSFTTATQGLRLRGLRLQEGGTQGPTIGPSDPIQSTTISPSSLPESVFIEILATFNSFPDFVQRLSTVNIHRQSLLHLAVHLRYRELVQKLVAWGIDLNIKDVNGFTALHTAYLCGDLSTIDTLERGGAIKLSLDILGRPPIELASGATKAPKEHNQVGVIGDPKDRFDPWKQSGVWYVGASWVLLLSQSDHPPVPTAIWLTALSGMPPLIYPRQLITPF